MARSSLTLRVREEVGKGPAGRLRRRGLLPGILYGREVGNLPVEVDLKEMKRVLGREGESALVQVKLEQGGQVREYTALVREVQRHPIRGELVHIDFYQVPAGEKITANVPVVLEGEPRGVKIGGILQHGLHEVEVECLPEDLPEAITVDVSGLDIGDHLTVADLTPPRGVTILSEPTSLIATVVSVRGTEAEETAEEGQEGSEEGAS
ncbi:50S ribosomal protein L25/general stress protein Ctc [Thermanaeromonas sp. C210]|uniref:50S ribosomal protein L25/general stress protein Ctc n=1 Tax=Thermanaeromonas sp. C210 TaxID=2731925 RepID=UPI00155D54B7|nr:50S ribosomal protein L25/general stress protein Ctc [Thermanaeromonas sp. C210]GFN21752.1 50S ribosomal protein L25 [Thermanaeromonas sp. C210]